MLYNVDFEVVGIGILIILYYFLCTQYSMQSETTNAFRRFIFFMILTEAMDILTAYTISKAASIPSWVNFVLNTFYFGLSLFLQFQYVRYVCSYIRQYHRHSNMEVVCRYIGGFYGLLLLLNIFTGILFSFDKNGEYIRGPLYILVFVLPSFYVFYTVVVVLHNKNSFMAKQVLSIVSFAIISTIGSVVQVFWLPNILLSVFSPTIGAFLCMLALETPDYQKLMLTLEELSEAKAAVEKADKAKTEFLTNMSHEIRTPINAVLGYNELIIKQTREESVIEYSRNAQAAGRALLSMVNDILDYTDFDQGVIRIANDEYLVPLMMDDILTYIEYNTKRKSLQCKTEIDKDIPQLLMGDAVRINQIINNIISNAVKYTNQGYVGLKVRWEKITDEQGYLCIEVSDTGNGMPPEQVQLIMDKFNQTQETSEDNISEIGFGLSIVIRLLHLMDGQLQVESTLKEGSRVSIKLKQQVVEYSIEDDDEVSVYAPEATILLADDNRMNQELVLGLLRNTGVHFDTAANGREAIEQVKNNEYDLVILDHMMPVMDGVEAFIEISRQGLCPNTPIIVLTANAVAGAREKYLKVGFDAYLSKPVTQKQLLKTLYDFLPYEKIQEVKVIESKTGTSSETGEPLEGFEFLDTVTGMAYCADSREFYLEMLESYVKHSRIQELNQLYTDKEWKDYQVSIHALKSTSLSIGAVELSEEAKALEFAIRDEHLDYVKSNHSRVMEEYQTVLDEISKALLDTQKNS